MLGEQGCAILRGGAVHPVLVPPPGDLADGTLTLPLAALPQETVLVRPGPPYPELLVSPLDHGVRHVVTARCPHKGCVVDWNAASAQWDCPCHGSRFDAAGKLLHGPAREPLAAPPAQVENGALRIRLAGLEDRA